MIPCYFSAMRGNSTPGSLETWMIVCRCGLMTACEGLIYHFPFLRTLDIWLNILSSLTFHGNVFTHDKYMTLGGYINRNNKYINGKRSFQPCVQKWGLEKKSFVRNVLWRPGMLLIDHTFSWNVEGDKIFSLIFNSMQYWAGMYFFRHFASVVHYVKREKG